MSQNAIANYMFANDYNNVTSNFDSLTSRLDSALTKYNENRNLLKADINEAESLKTILENIKSINSHQEINLLKNSSVLSSLADGIATFNLYPSGSYEKYTTAIKWKSDAEAIQSDWVSVGNDLKLSWASLLLESLDDAEE